MEAGTLFVAALDWEARAVRVETPDRVVRSGIGPERAGRALDRALAARGAVALVSTGCAGSLVDELGPGTMSIATAVVLPDGERIATDPGLVAQLSKRARAAGVPFRTSAHFGSDDLLHGADRKRRIAETTGCIAVDMESGAVALRARREGLPLAVVRVILDSVDDPIPTGLVDADGRIRIPGLLATLVRPAGLVGLLRLARRRRTAETVLRTFYAGGPSRSSPAR